MPAYYDQLASFGNATVEDQNRLQKLPFYLVKNEVQQFPIWNVFDQLYGTKQWQPNMGDTMRGVTPQRSPVGRVLFFPNAITQVPKKDVYQVTESVENAILYSHWYESFQFNFVPSFDAFWRDYIQFADNDIVQKISVANNQFIETQMWGASPYVYVAGTGVTSAPTGLMESTLTAAGTKTTAWLAGQVANIKNNLSLRTIYRARLALAEDFAAPPFEKALNMPKDNEGLKGKYVMLGSSEAWAALLYDTDTNLLKSIQLDLLFEDYNGLLFGDIVWKFHRYPMRFTAAGAFVVPEVFDNTDNKWKVNPDWASLTNAPYEVAWLLGASVCSTIKVGPPPKEFATTSMSTEKFYSLRWNGEVLLTDQVPIVFPDGSWDFNHYGTQLKLISMTTHGYLRGEPRYGMPIIFRRTRPAELP